MLKLPQRKDFQKKVGRPLLGLLSYIWGMVYVMADGGGGSGNRAFRQKSIPSKKKENAPTLAKAMAMPKGNYNSPDKRPSEAQMQMQRMKRWKKPESSGRKSTSKHQGNPNARY